MRIDDKKVPDGAFFDTSSLLDALIGNDRPEWSTDRKREAEFGRELFQAVLVGGGTVYSSSVALAEIMRGAELEEPHFAGLVFHPFDNKCARLFSRHFKGGATRPAPGETKAAIKFDALIIATALRISPRFPFVTADEHQKRRAGEAGLDARRPSEFEAPQQDLFESAGSSQGTKEPE